MAHYSYYFAANEYGCEAYGAGTYNSSCTAAAGGGTGGSSSGGGLLADTGYAVLIPMALAAAIAGVALFVLVKRLVHRKKSGGEPGQLV